MDDAERAAMMTRLHIIRTMVSAIDEFLKTDALDPSVINDGFAGTTRAKMENVRQSLNARAEKLHNRIQNT